MEVLQAQRRTQAPWRNGGGLTAEVAASPQDAGLEAFFWRISLATLAAAGPFSVFAGIDRRLAVLSGAVSLSLDGRTPVQMTRETSPLRFRGETPVQASLPDGPAVALNVMVRRSAWAAGLRRIEGDAGRRLTAGAADLLIVACGAARVRQEGIETPLAPLDAVRVAPGEPAVVWTGEAWVVRLRPKPRWRAVADHALT